MLNASFSIEKLIQNLSNFAIQYFPEITSSNDYLLNNHKQFKHLTLVISDYQTAGRGQWERKWVAKPNQQILFSLLYRIPKMTDLSGLSLVVGVAIVQTLRKNFSHLGASNTYLKWANDLLFQGKKFAGILIEIVSFDEKFWSVVIGVGINHQPEELDIETSSLIEMLGNDIPREDILIQLLPELVENLMIFEKQGFGVFQAQFNHLDHFYQQPIHIQTADKKYQGIEQGVDQYGNLLLEVENKLLSFSQGDARIVKR